MNYNYDLNIYFQDSITEIKKQFNLFDATKNGGKKYYSFETYKNKRENDKLLFKIHLFSGVFNLDVYDFNDPLNENSKPKINYSFRIENHNIILFEK